MSRPAWYRGQQYKKPMEPTQIADGSVVSVTQLAPGTLLLFRKWPENHKPATDRIRICVDDHGSYSYQVAEHDQFGYAKEFIGDPDWHAPFAYSNAIPGTSPSSVDTYDPRTGTHQETRKDLLDYYNQCGYQLISMSEQINAHDKYRPKPPGLNEINRDRFYGARPNTPEGAQGSAYREDFSKIGNWGDND
jgi:hypothetical protein